MPLQASPQDVTFLSLLIEPEFAKTTVVFIDLNLAAGSIV